MGSDTIHRTVKCPRCKQLVEITGRPGEKKIVICRQCGVKGFFQFDELSTKDQQNVIEIYNLTKKYKDITAVDSISFTVKKGEIFGFLGPNGAGKTTTIRTLLGLLNPDKGTAFVGGLDIASHIVEIRKKVGYIPGELALYEHLTGLQCLNYFSSLRNTNLSLLHDLQSIFEVPMNRKIKTYSRGMKQKLGIIQAFMDEPDIVIMDEPTSGLDPLLQQKFYHFLKSEKAKGKTIFFSSHILSEVEKICDRVAIIQNGQIVALEKIEELKAKKGKKLRLKIKESSDELVTKLNAELNNGWIECIIHDNIDEIIKKISHFSIVDMQIQEFSLEDIFMHYYGEREKR
jgi:ABC-2 type transport system ATP-binding protein